MLRSDINATDTEIGLCAGDLRWKLNIIIQVTSKDSSFIENPLVVAYKSITLHTFKSERMLIQL